MHVWLLYSTSWFWKIFITVFCMWIVFAAIIFSDERSRSKWYRHHHSSWGVHAVRMLMWSCALIYLSVFNPITGEEMRSPEKIGDHASSAKYQPSIGILANPASRTLLLYSKFIVYLINNLKGFHIFLESLVLLNFV